jgi:hypothetical protein
MILAEIRFVDQGFVARANIHWYSPLLAITARFCAFASTQAAGKQL